MFTENFFHDVRLRMTKERLDAQNKAIEEKLTQEIKAGNISIEMEYSINDHGGDPFTAPSWNCDARIFYPEHDKETKALREKIVKLEGRNETQSDTIRQYHKEKDESRERIAYLENQLNIAISEGNEWQRKCNSVPLLKKTISDQYNEICTLRGELREEREVVDVAADPASWSWQGISRYAKDIKSKRKIKL
jgi:hypothetical protein